jgi:fatty acid synthase subunit alpha, fungi type
VCILQGPVAARHSKLKDEPIKDLLGNINSTLIDRLMTRQYGGDMTKVPTIDYLSAEPVPSTTTSSQRSSAVEHSVGEDVPEANFWLETLAGSKLSWLRAFLTSPIIVRGASYIDSPVRRILAPRRGQKIHIEFEGDAPTSLVVYGAARSYGMHKTTFKAIEVKYCPRDRRIDLTMFEDRCDVSVPLQLQFKYEPSMGYAPIHEATEGRNRRIKEFYWKLWYGDDAELPEIDINETFVLPEVTINAEAIETFCAVVGNMDQNFKIARNSEVQAPMDFAIVIGWQVCS